MVLAFTHGRKIPKIIQKINKALGIKKSSEDLWDIIDIKDIIKDVDENTEDIQANMGNIS